MKKFFLLLIAVSIALTGCTKTIRYSPEEIKDFQPAVQEHIKKNEIAVGMTKLQVRYAWGGPDIINILPPGEGGKERIEWTFTKFRVFKTRLIFTDDRLTEIISTEPGIAR